MSCVTYHLPHVTCHLTITLCSFTCYLGPWKFDDAGAGNLVKNRVKYVNASS